MRNIKTGFGLSLGFNLLTIIMIIVAIALFVPGFILVRREQKKAKNGEEENNARKITGYVLMGFGMVFGFGFGASGFFSLLSNDV